MIRNLGMSLFLAMGIVTYLPACTSASSVCETICECEHCNKYRELSQCRSMERTEARADAYGCSDQNSALLDCILEKGRCDEEKSNYIMTAPGQCVQQPQGMSCMSAADCNGFDPQCTNGECTQGICAGVGASCSSDSDCEGGGPSVCESEQDALSKCISDASDRDN